MKTTSARLQQLLNSPAMAAPAGVRPNFVNPSNLTTDLYVILAICLTVSVSAVGMRMWTQTRLVRRVFLEDCSFFSHCWITLMTDYCRDLLFGAGKILQFISIQANEQTTFFILCPMIVFTARNHLGVHQWNLKLKDLSGFLYVWCWLMALRWNWQDFQWYRFAEIAYVFVIFLIKFAILLQYLRMFVPTKERNAMFWTCHGLIWLNFMHHSACFFLGIFACKSIEKFWNPWIKGRCFEINSTTIISATINTVSDLSILILLQYIIWNLQMFLKKKLGISAIFLIGILWVQAVNSS